MKRDVLRYSDTFVYDWLPVHVPVSVYPQKEKEKETKKEINKDTCI